MALPATANFTGTNGNEVRSLADWDGALTDALSGGACEIQSNQAQASASGTIGADWYTSETFSNDQKASATVKAITSGVYIGVAVRCSGTDNAGTLTGYLFYSDSADGCYIDKIVSGSYVASIAGPGTVFSVNDTIELSISGSALTAKVNGTTRLSTTDTAITTGRPGIAAYGTGASAIDDWTGDNLSIGGSGTLTATLAAATVSSAGTVALNGTATPTLAAATLSSAAKVAIVSTLTKTLDAATLSAAGTLAATGSGALTATLANATVSSAGTVALVGTLTATLAAATVSAAGTVAIVGTLTKTLDAATVSSAGTIGNTGILAKTLADVTAASTGYHVAGACIGGVLTVNATNGRYFDNDAGPIVLAGFHTWQVSGAENSDSDPPAAFDFDEFLTALTTKGVNFSKIWAMETPEDWPNLSPMYFAPLPWARTGPGTAADGKPKFDLTKFDPHYFSRMREYAVRLGNAGIYCAVQFFQGWHIAQKGYSVGSPGTYHPFNAANNINSIDGDTDNDGELVESRDTSLTSIYNLQKAYVEKVIDTLGDLDHILWEVENEGESDLTWQRAIAAYIKTYESGKPKQHPVGLTKLYPGGSNSDLYASDVEWTSIDDDYPTPVPDEADGSMVILWDTDHVLGLTTDWRLSWMSFTRGNNPVYMDEWNGWTYGTDRRADADAEKYRANLGYILDYVARVDIVGMTPQGSLASTGYCLAKTTGRQQLIAYQPSSGNFTVDLTGMAGTFSVEFLRCSNGATNTGTTVAGGAVRTLTAPWAGEDYVAFVELSAVAGTLTKTLDNAAVSATGTLGATATGTLTATLAAATVSSTGALALKATTTATLAAATVTATATLANTGALTATLESATLAATGATGAFAVGALTATLADATATSTATLAIAGATTAALDAATLSSAAALANTGTLTATLASATVVAVGVEVVIVSIVAGTIRGAGASGTVHGAGISGTVRA